MFVFLLVICVPGGLSPALADLKVTERTNSYIVSGRSIQSVVKAMKRGGPYSENHGRRALGLADFRLSTRVRTERSKGGCGVVQADVRMAIFYTVPRLSSHAKLSRRDRSRWRRISAMIRAHEKQHGRYYRRFAGELHVALSRIKPQKTCSQLLDQARKIRRRLEAQNQSRNRRYDRAQYRPFNKRLKRLAPSIGI